MVEGAPEWPRIGSLPPRGADRPRDEHAGHHLHEWQPSPRGLLAEPAHDRVDVPLAPAAAPPVHLASPRSALAAAAPRDAESREQACQFRSRPLAGRRPPRIRRVSFVDGPSIALPQHHARHDLVERVAPLPASGREVLPVAGDHASGFAPGSPTEHPLVSRGIAESTALP